MWEYEGYDVPDRLYGEIDVPMCFGKYDKKDEDCFFCDVNNECKKEREKVLKMKKREMKKADWNIEDVERWVNREI